MSKEMAALRAYWHLQRRWRPLGPASIVREDGGPNGLLTSPEELAATSTFQQSKAALITVRCRELAFPGLKWSLAVNKISKNRAHAGTVFLSAFCETRPLLAEEGTPSAKHSLKQYFVCFFVKLDPSQQK